MSNYKWTNSGFSAPSYLYLPGASVVRALPMIIGVTTGNSSQAADYLVTVVTSDYNTWLQPGVPVSSQISANADRYYVFAITDITKDVLVSVGITSGAVTLYFSDSENRHPSASNSDFASDPQFQQTGIFRVTPAMITNSTCRNNLAAGFACGLFINVHSSSPMTTSFIITVLQSGSPTEYTRLIEDITMVGSVNTSQWAYYEAAVNEPTWEDLFVTLVPYTGDADLYVNIGINRPFPNASAHDYMSVHFTGPDTVHIKATDALYCSSCTLFIGVYGFQSSIYSIAFRSRWVGGAAAVEAVCGRDGACVCACVCGSCVCVCRCVLDHVWFVA